jgi:hypothetical protein
MLDEQNNEVGQKRGRQNQTPGLAPRAPRRSPALATASSGTAAATRNLSLLL